MPSMIVNNIDTGNVIMDNATHRDKLLTFAGAGTLASGTVLATQRVNTTPTASANVGTGNGTVTALSVLAGQTPVAGAWTFKCTSAVTNGGVFSLFNPSGSLVASGITLTPGAGGTTVVKAGGMQFTVTDGSTDFAVGDTFTITVAAVEKLVPYSSTGAGGAETATDVLTYDVTATGAGDVPIRSMVEGRVRKERLLIDNPQVAVTAAVIEQLRARGITAVECKELGKLDNQLP